MSQHISMSKLFTSFLININFSRSKMTEEEALDLIKRAICMENAQLLDDLLTAHKTSEITTEALFFAVHKGSRDMVKIILNHGADIHSYKECKFSGGFVARYNVLTCAIKSGNAETVRFVIESGASVSASVCVIPGIFMKPHYTELEIAILAGNAKIVQILLDYGASVHQVVSDYYSPIFCAALYNKLDIVALLLSYGAKINGHGGESDISPIGCAASKGHDRIVKYLLDQGANREDNALEQAILYKHLKVIEVLLNGGHDVNRIFSHHPYAGSPLDTAVRYASGKVVNLLLAYGARINESEKNLFWRAFEEDKMSILQLLLDRGADINVNIDPEAISMYFGLYRTGLIANHCIKFILLVRRVMLLKAQNLYISDVIWNEIITTGKLDNLVVKCEREIELMKAEQLDNLSLTCYDILITKDLDKLAALTSNENIVKVLKSKDFKKKFPVYRGLIVHNLNSGIARKHDFEFVKRFFNYLSLRKVDKLPKLPFICVGEIFSHLSGKDVCDLKRILMSQ